MITGMHAGNPPTPPSIEIVNVQLPPPNSINYFENNGKRLDTQHPLIFFLVSVKYFKKVGRVLAPQSF